MQSVSSSHLRLYHLPRGFHAKYLKCLIRSGTGSMNCVAALEEEGGGGREGKIPGNGAHCFNQDLLSESLVGPLPAVIQPPT